MEFSPIDVLSEIKEQVATQYSDSPNMLLYMESLLEPFEELEQVFADILNLRMLDNAENAQLDTNGELVALSRGVYNIESILFFGLDADDINNPVLHSGLGDLNDASIGGFLRSIEQPLSARIFLPDNDYRKSIKGKIKKNNFKGGVESVLETIETVISVDIGGLEIVEDFTTPSDPVVNIIFNRALDDKEKSFLVISKVIPKGGGIRYEYFDTNGPFS